MSNKTMPWSLFIPIGGNGLHMILKPWWFVKIRSRAFPCLVGRSTIFKVLGLELYPRKSGLLDVDKTCYCPYTILWKPPFCILHCFKTPTYKYDIFILLHSKSHKKCRKNFENRFINKNSRPKNDLDLVFYMCKGGNPKSLNLEF